MLLKRRKKIDLKEINERLNSKNVYKNFFLFVMGLLVSSISTSVFYNTYDIVAGGSGGFAILINNYINIDLSLIIFAISSITLVIGFCAFGNEYGAKNILATIFSPIFIKATSLINNVVDFDGISLFTLVIFGAVLSGIGFGLIKKSGYSSGGFGVLYDIMNVKFKISVGKANLIFNTFIIILSLFVFGIKECIYGFMALYISSQIADRIMIGISDNKAFYIITKKPEEVSDYIVHNLKYTTTVVNARGGYSNKKKKMLICVIPTIYYTRLKEVVKEIDKDVFFLITDSYFVSK